MNDKDKLILKIANITLDDIRGSTVHPSENFDPVECYLLSMEEDKMIAYINAGIEEYIKEGDSDFYLLEDLTIFKFGALGDINDYDDYIHFHKLDGLIGEMHRQNDNSKYYEEHPDYAEKQKKKNPVKFERKQNQYLKINQILTKIPKLKEFFDTVPKWQRKKI